jgi:hypothetical protein
MNRLINKLDAVKSEYDRLIMQHDERKADGDATERDYEDMMDEEAILEEEMEELSLAIKEGFIRNTAYMRSKRGLVHQIQPSMIHASTKEDK